MSSAVRGALGVKAEQLRAHIRLSLVVATFERERERRLHVLKTSLIEQMPLRDHSAQRERLVAQARKPALLLCVVDHVGEVVDAAAESIGMDRTNGTLSASCQGEVRHAELLKLHAQRRERLLS